MSLPQNIHPFERAVSVAAGLTAISVGYYRGGNTGVLTALGGVALLQRGLSGHCTLKGLISNPGAEISYLRQRVAELRAALPKAPGQPSYDARPQGATVDSVEQKAAPTGYPIIS
jgi:hypothetical protein